MAKLTHVLTLILLTLVATVFASPANSGNVRFARAANPASKTARSAEPEPETNAARLARGLTPLTPRQLYSPTRLRRATTSAVPGQTLTGHIALYSGSSLFGYVSSNRVVSSTSSASLFQYTQGATATTPVNIASSGSASTLYWGMAQSTLSTTIGPGSSGYILPRNTATKTPANAGPTYDSSLSAYSETSVFEINPTTLVITPQYVSSTGSKPTTYLVSTTTNILFYTGDVSAFSASTGLSVTPLTMKFVAS